jgi:3-hydroxyisobutyrate dehydrogenase
MTDGDRDTIAVLGTGIMGGGIARNLIAAGFPVRVWNRSREKAEPLVAAGAETAESPAEAAVGADIVLTMLSDADALVEVMSDGPLEAGPRVWVQMSTVGLEGTERLAELAAEHDVAFVDAPVLGTRQPAEEGQLRVLASGPDEALDRCQPLFDAVGSRTFRLGPAGQGSRTKLVTNLWVLTLVEGVAEALALAEGLGVDPTTFLDTIADGPLDSPYAKTKAKAMIEREFPTSFPLRWASKDADLIRAAAAETGLELPLAEGVADALARGVHAGHGDEDMAATFLASTPAGPSRG